MVADTKLPKSARASIMILLKNKFESLIIWSRLESQLALLCADLPEITDDSKRDIFADGIESIKDYLIDNKILKSDLKFLDDEIEFYRNTKQISLYVEEEDELDPGIIDRYARMSMNTEGVIGIHHSLNYKQLSKLTNGVFDKTRLIKFYISAERVLSGQIVAEIYEQAQMIPIATLVESKKLNDVGEPQFKKVALFGERFTRAEYTRIKEIEIPFYVYRFISNKNKDYILMSPDRCNIGDYMITGMETQCDDYKKISDSAKIPTKLPFFFAQKVQNRILKFKDHDDFKERIESLGITKSNIWNYPFTAYSNKKRKHLILKHPTWFKWLVWSFLLHANTGLSNEYPFHILIVAKKGTGKSYILNGLHSRSKEIQPIFSGAGSTLKSLIASFKETIPKIGYLATANRFAFCDEFLRCIFNTKSDSSNNIRDESFATMNDMLEHQKRAVGSGNSSININMTARMLAVTNATRGIDCMEDLSRRMDESFLSRLMVYFQDEQHITMIRGSKDEELKEYDMRLPKNDWVSIIDYLQSFSSKFDLVKVEKILNSMKPLLSETLLDHYDARHDHHIEALMDGIVKTRCLFDHDISFTANDKDYSTLKEIWTHIICSWIESVNIKELPIEDRIWHLPEKSQWLYWELVKIKDMITNSELRLKTKDTLSRKELNDAILLLRDNELIVDDDGDISVYYMTKGDENK